MNEEIISLQEAAALSGLSASHLRLLCRTGKLEGKRVGSYWVTTRRAVAEYLADEQKRKKGPKGGRAS